jgi:hypothetical protein
MPSGHFCLFPFEIRLEAFHYWFFTKRNYEKQPESRYVFGYIKFNLKSM